MRRVWVLLSVLLALVLLLAACVPVDPPEEEAVADSREEEVIDDPEVPTEEPEETPTEEPEETPTEEPEEVPPDEPGDDEPGPETVWVLLPFRGDASDRVKADIEDVGAQIGIDVAVEFVDPGTYLEILFSRVESGEELPDIVELTDEQLPFVVDTGLLVPLSVYLDEREFEYAVFGREVGEEVYTMRWSPEFCYSYLGVMNSGHEDLAFSLLTTLAGRTGGDCANLAFPDAEVWFPYDGPQPYEVIGDATLVPGHPAILFALSQMEGYLAEEGVKVNSARAVMLREPPGTEGYEEPFETTYFAPVGPEVEPGDEATVVGLVFIDALDAELPLEPGAYAVRVLPEYEIVEYIDPAQNVVLEVDAGFEEGDEGAPTAGILYGTKTCRVWIPFIGFITYACGWF